MTAKHIKLVKKSWFMFRHIAPEIIADAFYSRLFMEHPDLRPMFPQDMQGQYEKLIGMLNIVVGRLERLDELTKDIADLAVRHKGYGTKPEHYAAVGKALLWTLAMGLGSDWDEETEMLGSLVILYCQKR